MDTKALAKSKRAHSQHHSKKSHSSQKSKTLSDASKEAGITKKTPGKQVKDNNNLQIQSKSKLPSNWDRYDEEFSVNPDGLSNEAAKVPDGILPKSKGADYRHLIAEAQSQMQSYTFMDVFPSLDDVLPRELSGGGSAIVAERGEGILSWIGDDSFIVDEKATANPEAPFLSLNLQTLADQLEKIDFAERLFLEEDLLPSELRSEGKMVEQSPITELDEKCNFIGSFRDSTSASSGSSRSNHQDPTFNPSPILSNKVNNVDPMELEISSRIKAPKYEEQLNTKIMIENESKKTSKFEAAAAEAELDLLLSSFSETMDLENPAAASNTSEFDEVFNAPPRLPIGGRDLANKVPVAAELDDVLDGLLQETSIPKSHKDKSFPCQLPSLSPKSETKSIAKDDFDSWLDTI